MSQPELFTFVLLGMTIAGLWLGPWVWVPLFLSALALGYYAGVLHGYAAAIIALLAVSTWQYRHARSGWLRFISALVMVVLSLLLGLHLMPGFSNPQILNDAVLSRGAAPYDLYLNFDKTVPGILFLGLAYHGLIRTRGELLQALRTAWPVLLVTSVVIMAASLSLGYLKFAPHWTPVFWVWAFSNLFLTCMAEEAFFRGFLLTGLRSWLGSHSAAPWLALLASSLLFGLAHLAGGWQYVLLATLAGTGYGYAYQRSGRIEMAILAHFLVNLAHFLFFTYPAACAAVRC